MESKNIRIRFTTSSLERLISAWDNFDQNSELHKNFSREYLAVSILRELMYLQRGQFSEVNPDVSKVLIKINQFIEKESQQITLNALNGLDVDACHHLHTNYMSLAQELWSQPDVRDEDVFKDLDEHAKQVLKFRDDCGLVLEGIHYYSEHYSDPDLISRSILLDEKIGSFDSELRAELNKYYVAYDFAKSFVEEGNINDRVKWWWWFDLIDLVEEHHLRSLLSIAKFGPSSKPRSNQIQALSEYDGLISGFISNTLDQSEWESLSREVTNDPSFLERLVEAINYFSAKNPKALDEDIQSKLFMFLEDIRSQAGGVTDQEIEIPAYSRLAASSSIEVNQMKPGIYGMFVNKGTHGGILCRVDAKTELRKGPGEGEWGLIKENAPELQQSLRKASQLALRKLDVNDPKKYDVSYNIDTIKYVEGESIQLAAFLSVLASLDFIKLQKIVACTGKTDPLTGNIGRVDDVTSKLKAALDTHCDLIFLPEVNKTEVPDSDLPQIKFVNNVDEVLSTIRGTELSHNSDRNEGDPATSYLLNKIEELKQSGLQVGSITELQNCKRVAVAGLGEKNPVLLDVFYGKKGITPVVKGSPNSLLFIKVQNIVSHVAAHNDAEPSERKVRLRVSLPVLDSQRLEDIRKNLRNLFQNSLKEVQEQNCVYRYDIVFGDEHVSIKQYSNGTLLIQGEQGQAWNEIKDQIHRITGQVLTETQIDNDNDQNRIVKDQRSTTDPSITGPWIGVDESGKGDYFGPLVIAGVLVDKEIEIDLRKIGVRDSKLLNDKQATHIASQIESVCKGRFDLVRIFPTRYNELYEEHGIQHNLNRLLAWGHARVIENILAKHQVGNAISDQFGDESFILDALMAKGKSIKLIQRHRAEQNTGVAAASILARAEFLKGLSKLSQEIGFNLLKGASDQVVAVARTIYKQHGKPGLEKVAKLHFKTTQKIIKD